MDLVCTFTQEQTTLVQRIIITSLNGPAQAGIHDHMTVRFINQPFQKCNWKDRTGRDGDILVNR
jgi:hypothetical protein